MNNDNQRCRTRRGRLAQDRVWARLNRTQPRSRCSRPTVGWELWPGLPASWPRLDSPFGQEPGVRIAGSDMMEAGKVHVRTGGAGGEH